MHRGTVLSHARLIVIVSGDLWDSTLGYEGEGPGKKQSRNARAGAGRPPASRTQQHASRGRGGPEPTRRSTPVEEPASAFAPDVNPCTHPRHLFT